MSELKGAIIGCGFFARNHLNAWNDVQGARLVAVCDIDPAKAEAAAAMTGAKPYTDARAMLAEEKLDFVDIATTMESHEALMALAAEHKLAAICQKPFAPDLPAVRRILERAEAAGRPIMVHENFRFQTPLIATQKVDRLRRHRQAVLRPHQLAHRLRRGGGPALSRQDGTVHHPRSRHPRAGRGALHDGRGPRDLRQDPEDHADRDRREPGDDAAGPRRRRRSRRWSAATPPASTPIPSPRP